MNTGAERWAFLGFHFHFTAVTGSTHFDITLHEQTLVVTITVMVPGFGTFVLWGFEDWFRAFFNHLFFFISYQFFITVKLLVLQFTVFTSVSFSVKLLCCVFQLYIFVTSCFNLTQFLFWSGFYWMLLLETQPWTVCKVYRDTVIFLKSTVKADPCKNKMSQK